ncbi:MAG TPA: glycosyltransferase family 4 protein [Chloroflexota bacterium]
MSRPHVVYVTPIFGYPAFGGPRLRTYNTLRALARVADVSLYVTQQPDTPDRERARAHLLSFCRDVTFPPPPAPPARAPLTRLALRALRAALPRSVRRRLRAASNQKAEVADRTTQDAASLETLVGWVAANRPDLVWLGFGGISYHLVPLGERTSTPLVLETECVWSRFVLRELPFEPDAFRRDQIQRDGRAKEQEERSGALHTDITTAVSDVDAAYFRSIAPDPERVMLLANTIDVAAYANDRASIRLRQPALLFTGTLSHGTANVDASLWLLDEIMPRVWRSRPDVHVYLVGRSPAPAIVARRGRRVHVTGEVPSITPYMRASAAALVPLRWESGTRFKILEAFACRTPVISTTLGAEGLNVEHGRHLLLADEPGAFASAVLEVVNDRRAGQRLTEPAFDLVQREYDLSAAERQIEAILSRLGVLPVTGSDTRRGPAHQRVAASEV